MTHHTSTSSTSEALQDAEPYGLVQMSKVEPFMTSFILSAEEAWISHARCPWQNAKLQRIILFTHIIWHHAWVI